MVQKKSKNFKFGRGGFSTLEVLMAMFVLVLAVTGAVQIAFGSQSMLISGQSSAEALEKARAALEQAQFLGRRDFRLVNPAGSSDGYYITQILVTPAAEFFKKTVMAKVSWNSEGKQARSIELQTTITDFNNVSGGDTCDSMLSPDADAWQMPKLKAAFSGFSALAGAGDKFSVTDVDAYKNRLYVTVNNRAASTTTAPAFFVFDISDREKIVPVPGGFADNDPLGKGGINAVAAADFLDAFGNKKIYAYVANASGARAGQLQVFEVSSNGGDTIPPQLKASLELPAPGGGNSIFYRDGYVYLGLEHDGAGPEFHIINVRDPLNPKLVPGGNYAVGNGINAIYVKNNFAYLATPNSQELIVLDVSDLSNIKTGSPAWGYDAGGGGNGKSLYMIGDNLYLGRTIPNSGPEFLVLDARDPKKISANNAAPWALEINDSVDAVSVRSGFGGMPLVARNLAFLLTRFNFQIWDLADISPWTPKKTAAEFLVLPASGSSEFEPVMDCEGNRFYIGSNDASDNGYVFMIAP
jgi:Tfp pilus assembly protein PilV